MFVLLENRKLLDVSAISEKSKEKSKDFNEQGEAAASVSE